MALARSSGRWVMVAMLFAVAGCTAEEPSATRPGLAGNQDRVENGDHQDRADAACDRAEALIGERKFEPAIAELKEAIQADEYCVAAHYLLGWIHATCPDPQVRNGELAVKEAQAAIDADRYYDQFGVEDNRARWMGPACLAAAYAESGQFDKAIEAQDDALKLTQHVPIEDRGVQMRKIVDSRLRAALKLYQAGKPLRTYKIALSKLSEDWGNAVLQATDNDEFPKIAE